MLKHVLLARLREGTPEAVVQTVMAAFREMALNMEGCIAFEYGPNNSPEGRSRGFTHAVVLSFAGAEARDAYLSHPEHRTFSDWAGQLGIIEEMLVFDYIPQTGAAPEAV